MQVQFATQRLINSVWTLGYKQISDKEIEIVSYDRENVIGYDNERTLERCRPVEDEERNIVSVMFAPYDPFDFNVNREMTVVNSQNVFSYSN